MAAALFGTSGLEWGLDSETGGIMQSLQVRDFVQKGYVRNHEGEYVGKSTYNRMQVVTGKFVYTAATGLGAMAPGASTSAVASSEMPGTGLDIVDEIVTNLGNEQYKDRDFTIETIPGITA